MHGVGMVLGADVTDDDRLNIFYRNGERLLAAIGQQSAVDSRQL